VAHSEPLSAALLGAATWSDRVSPVQLREFAQRALALEAALSAEEANAAYWHNEVLRLREESE
jgi:hypothetical protein